MGCRDRASAFSPPSWVEARRGLAWPALLAVVLFGSASEIRLPEDSAPAPQATQGRSEPGYLDPSDFAREALPYARRLGLRLAAWDSPVPEAQGVSGAWAPFIAPPAVRSPLAPVSRPRGGLPAGFLPDHALSPPKSRLIRS